MKVKTKALIPVLSITLILTGFSSSMLTSTASAATKIKVTYIPKNLGNPYFDAIVKGFKKAAAGLNMTVTVVAPAQAGATDQIPYIQAAIQQKVTAIAISPNDLNALCPTLKRAMAKGIIVLTVNGDTAPGCRQASITPVDFSVLGAYLVKQTSKVIGGKGEWAFLSATSTAPDQNSWLIGAKAFIAGGGESGLKLVDTVYGDDEPAKSADETNALLTKYPNLAAINAPTTVGIAAAAQVLSTSPLKGKVQVTGLGTPDQMRQYVKDGTVKSFSLWDPGLEGQIAANLIVSIKNKRITPKVGATFRIKGVGPGTWKMGKDKVIIAGPPQEFNAANIDKFHF
jgi:rhamnose transport system substrate-binding protein